MQITTKRNGAELTVLPDGRIDTTTAPALEQCLSKELTEDVHTLVLDFERVGYISSAGLRVLLATHKKMKKQGSMTIRHVNDTIMDIFEVTGFVDILTIE